MNLKNKEKSLIESIIHKDERALLRFYRMYHKLVFFFIQKTLGDYHAAQELTQDVFMDFIEALPDFHYRSSVKTFLFSIAKNKTVDYIRKKKIKKILFSALPSYIVEGLKTILIDEEIEKKELQAKIRKTLDLLPDHYRFVLRLKYIEGESVKYIAQRLALGSKATESLIFRARKAFVSIFNNLA